MPIITKPRRSHGTMLAVAIGFLTLSLRSIALEAQPLPPAAVSATATSATRVDILWTMVSGATSYEIDRKGPGSAFAPLGTSSTNSFSDTTASPDTAYLYRVRAVNGGGTSPNSPADLATTVLMSDDPLMAGVSVKAIHLGQLRTAIGSVRLLANLSTAGTTDSAVSGTTIKAIHVTELRAALDEARAALGFSTGGYTDSSLTGVSVKAAHFQELREASGTTSFPSGRVGFPKTVTISPSDISITPGGNVQYTVTLDVPAVDPATVNLVLNPLNAGTLPSAVLIVPSQTNTTFTYTDTGLTNGTATVTATFGASFSLATVTTVPAGSHIVINEVDYDQIGTDSAEFIEIYNPTAGPVDLTNKAVMLVNGLSNAVYATIDLGSAGTLASHNYLVIAGPGVTVTPPATKIDPGWSVADNIQNGAPDGIALVDTVNHVLIDALSYEGAITMAILTGFPSPVSLVEGTALSASVADSNTVVGSLCRSPNGTDTDNASSDWKFCSAVTPGTANP